jgi:hypothetical protein
MPRAGWAAAGAVVVALAATGARLAGVPGGPAASLTGLAVAALLAISLRRSNGRGARAVLVVAALVAARLTFEPLEPPSTTAALEAGLAAPRSWAGTVVGVGAPRPSLPGHPARADDRDTGPGRAAAGRRLRSVPGRHRRRRDPPDDRPLDRQRG